MSLVRKAFMGPMSRVACQACSVPLRANYGPFLIERAVIVFVIVSVFSPLLLIEHGLLSWSAFAVVVLILAALQSRPSDSPSTGRARANSSYARF